MAKPVKIDIKLPLIKARCILLIGSYEDVLTNGIPFEIDCFGPDGYLARTAFKIRERPRDDLPFTVVIHSRSAAISVIAHEAVHAANFIQDSMGVVPDFNNDELTAYIVQYICEISEKKLGTYD